MKKICTLIFLIMVLLLTGCSTIKEELDPAITKELEENNWEYSATDTTYESTYESEYWNYLNDRYEKMFYEAAVNINFSDNIQKNIYLFYGDEANDYSWTSVVRAIQFARFDHPELELMNMDFSAGGAFSPDEGCLYQTVSYFSREFDEYAQKLNEVNSEIKDLVDEVNNTEDIVKKHLLIFNWITSNVTYMESGEEIGVVDFYNEEFILARMQTDSTQNIYGAIVNKVAICDGIADAYKYICNMCNLECIVVDGYISDASEERYHAWNLVKVNDTWYLVDATWDLGKEHSDYFMVKDLNKGERTPFDIVNDFPGYDDVISNQITFEETAETNVLTAENGIIFDLVDDNYSMSVYDDTIYIRVSSLGYERIFKENKEISKDVTLKTNSEITLIEYYDYSESLIKVAEATKSSDIVFLHALDDTYIRAMHVYLSFNGNTYKIKLEKSGA